MTHIFVHIPKTAGRTLELILRRNFCAQQQFDLNSWTSKSSKLDELAGLDESRKRHLRLIRGHQRFGVHTALLPETSRYFSFVREPLARAESLYQFIRRNPEHHLWQPAVESSGLVEFLDATRCVEFDNHQVRMIAGVADVPYGEISQDVLDRAIENVDQHFDLVGLTERFEDSLLLLAEDLNLSHLYYELRNVRPGESSGFSQHERERLEQLHLYDAELYQEMRLRLERRIGTHDSVKWNRRKQRLQRSNHWYGRMCNLGRRAKKALRWK